jgi:hypothetical protein
VGDDEADDWVGRALNSAPLIFVAFAIGVFTGGWLTEHIDWSAVSTAIFGS